jgi:hypothetical protein
MRVSTESAGNGRLPAPGSPAILIALLEGREYIADERCALTAPPPLKGHLMNGELFVTVGSVKSNPVEFLILPAAQETLRPDRGPATGATRAVLRTPDGTSLSGPPQVYFGNKPATNVRIVDSEHLACTTPPGTGRVTVQVRFGAYIRNIGSFTYEP